MIGDFPFPHIAYPAQYSTAQVLRYNSRLLFSYYPIIMLNKYHPAEIEAKHYQNWQNQGYFQPNMAAQPSFSIQLPPPNVTGTLHMGQYV